MEKRTPIGVWLIAILSLIGSLYALGTIFFTADAMGPFVILSLGVVIIQLALVYGFVKLRLWGWYGMIILSGLSLFSSIISLSIVGIIIHGTVVTYLSAIKEKFK